MKRGRQAEGFTADVASLIGRTCAVAASRRVCRYYEANNGVKPGCLLVYRDGVSDSELDRVRVDEVSSIIEVSSTHAASGTVPVVQTTCKQTCLHQQCSVLGAGDNVRVDEVSFFIGVRSLESRAVQL